MYIIADVGSNWATKQDCLDSIYYASKAGANAVKFQCYDHKKLYGYQDRMDHVLPLEWAPELARQAERYKIEFMATPFCPYDVKYLNDFVDKWKIASSDLAYPQILEAVAKTDKPVILSTGASTEEDISRAIQHLKQGKTFLMYCISDYPCKDHDLTFMEYLWHKHGVPVGLSDHSVDIYNTPYCAKYFFNAVILEKHFKIANMDTPDNGHSLHWHDFKRMVDRLKVRGTLNQWKTNHSELDMVQMHNRRLVALEEIQPGDELRFGVNFGAFRTKSRDATRISPFKWQELEGKTSKNKIFQGQALTYGDIQSSQ